MHVKKLDDSRVDEIIKRAEARHSSSTNLKKENISGTATKKIFPKIKLGVKLTKETGGLIVILVLLALSLIQSVELINLRQQIKSGQFSGANSGSSGNTQGLPSQQGGC